MEVILKQDVEKLGYKNDLVSVKPGYGRNYLIPQGLAMVANTSNRKQWEEFKKQEERREDKLMQELQSVIDKLKGAVVKVGAKAGTSEKIFGSITTLQLSEAIKNQLGVKLDRKKITLPEEVKMLGSYVAVASLHKELDVDFNFEVVAE